MQPTQTKLKMISEIVKFLAALLITKFPIALIMLFKTMEILLSG